MCICLDNDKRSNPAFLELTPEILRDDTNNEEAHETHRFADVDTSQLEGALSYRIKQDKKISSERLSTIGTLLVCCIMLMFLIRMNMQLHTLKLESGKLRNEMEELKSRNSDRYPHDAMGMNRSQDIITYYPDLAQWSMNISFCS